MAKFAQDFLNAAQVRCRLDFPVNLPDWPLSTDTRHNLFLAFKEVLNNAVKHSSASEVRLSLKVEPDSFVISIGDNGRGMAALPASEGAVCRNGISNLQHRLAQIGGRYEVASSVGGGTTALFFISHVNGTRNGSDNPPLPRHHAR
jgi:signal transduction histidine kinase